MKKIKNSACKWFIQAAINSIGTDAFYSINIFKRRFVCVCVCVSVFGVWHAMAKCPTTYQYSINDRTFVVVVVVSMIRCVYVCVCEFFSTIFRSIPLHPVHDSTRKVTKRLLIIILSIKWVREGEKERKKKKELMKRTKRFQLAQVCECDRAPSFQMKGMEHYVYWISIWIQVLWLSFFYIIIFNSWAHLKWTWELARVFVVWARTHSIHNTLHTHNECMRNAFCPVHFCAHAQTKRANAYS